MLKDFVSRKLTAVHLGSSVRNRSVEGIVLHDTAGNGLNDVHGVCNDAKYLANPGDGRTVSVDFVVGRDGVIYQLNPDLTKHWCLHAGRSTKFKNYRNSEVNVHTVGIEISQKVDLSLVPIYPSAQVQAVAQLCAELCVMFKLKKEDIVTHQQIIQDHTRTDPRKFPFDTFWGYFKGYAAEFHDIVDQENKDHVSVLVNPTYYTVVKGDTLSRISQRYGVPQEKLKALNPKAFADNPSTVIKIGQVLLVKE